MTVGNWYEVELLKCYQDTAMLVHSNLPLDCSHVYLAGLNINSIRSRFSEVVMRKQRTVVIQTNNEM